MKSNLISKSDTAKMLSDINEQWHVEIPKLKNLRIYELDDDARIIAGDGITALKIGDEYLPFLTETELLEKFPNVTVDMGAVKFMCDGANVMRPGIRNYSSFEKDQIVCVVEESQRKFLAVGKALVSSIDMETMVKGPVIKNMHFVSDKYWEIKKTIKE